MQKQILFIDLDESKFHTLDQHINYINTKYGINSVPADYIGNPKFQSVIAKYIDHFDIPEGIIYEDIALNFLSSIEWHETVTPLDDACRIIPELAKKYELHTVTARPDVSLGVIQYLLEKHLPECIQNIHCVHQYLGDARFAKISKREYIEKISGQKAGFIDDSPQEIERVKNIIPAYLLDPFGHHDHLKNIPNRVRCWKEIGKIFL